MHGILEVEHAGVGIAQHEVARHVVAVHVDLRLGEGAAHERGEHAFEHGSRRRIGLALQMAREVPLREEIQLTPQQRLVVGRQLALSRRELPAEQRLGGIGKKRVRVGAVEHIEIRADAKIVEQQEPSCQVLADDFRRMHAGLMQELCDMHEGPAVLALGRRVHGNVGRAVRKRGTKVAPEACVRGGWGELEFGAELA